MNMRVPNSPPSRYHSSPAGDPPPKTPTNDSPDPALSKADRMRGALDNYILNNGINDIQKKQNKIEQLHKKNVAKQKERKAEEEQ